MQHHEILESNHNPDRDGPQRYLALVQRDKDGRCAVITIDEIANQVQRGWLTSGPCGSSTAVDYVVTRWETENQARVHYKALTEPRDIYPPGYGGR